MNGSKLLDMTLDNLKYVAVKMGIENSQEEENGTYKQGLKMFGSAGSGAARKWLPADPHRKFVTISQEIFRVKSPMLYE